jgi:hypothetical protein
MLIKPVSQRYQKYSIAFHKSPYLTFVALFSASWSSFFGPFRHTHHLMLPKSPFPLHGQAFSALSVIPTTSCYRSPHFRFMVKHFWPFPSYPPPHATEVPMSASWSSIFGPFRHTHHLMLPKSPFPLHGQAFLALFAQAPCKKMWGYDVFGLFCFIMKPNDSQPKPAIRSCESFCNQPMTHTA